jgi:hypothetical protein
MTGIQRLVLVLGMVLLAGCLLYPRWAIKVTLNGWQRLWVVVTAPWAVLWVGGALLFGFDGSGVFLLSIIVVPPVLLYAVGLGVVWVRRGFHQPKA